MKSEKLKMQESMKSESQISAVEITSMEGAGKRKNQEIDSESIIALVQELLEKGKSVVLLKGNAGRDAETVPNTEGQLAKFTLAVNQFVFNKEADPTDEGSRIKKETQWYDIEVRRGKVAQALEQVHKGSRIILVGQLRRRSYINKLGQTVNDTKVIVNDFWVGAA